MDLRSLWSDPQGTLVIAPNCHRAFDDCYYLEGACQFQMTSLAAVGGDVSKLKLLDQALLDSPHTQEVGIILYLPLKLIELIFI